jgi:hypothetical protein
MKSSASIVICLLFIYGIMMNLAFVQAQPYILDEKKHLIYPRAGEPPQIDGVLDYVWYNTPWYPMAHNAQGYPFVPEDWYDSSGEWRAMWDADYIYFFVEIRDETLNAGLDWNWDSLELYTDADDSHGESYDGVDDFQFRIHYDDAARSITVWTNDKGPQIDTAKFKWEQQVTEYGWTAEIAVPAGDIFLSPEPGVIIGTDMEYNDNDEGAECNHKLLAFGDVENAWQYPSYMGEAVLSDWTAATRLSVVRTKTKPTIDGELDDMWRDVPAIPASCYMDMSKIDDRYDLSMTTQMMWDENYLYQFIRVWDEKFIRDGSGDYQDDGIEVYFDGDYSHTTTYDGLNDMQIAFAYQIGGEPLDAAHQVGSTTGFDLSGIIQASKFTTDGLVLEVAYPLNLLQIVPEAGSVFGIEIDYNDDDDGGDRDAKLKTYSMVDDTWQNPNRMAPAMLVSNYSVSVSDGIDMQPESSLLAQNYPNPFNPVTTISYTLPENGAARLTVLNVTGQEIGTLVDKIQQAGQYTVSFNGSDLSSGVYFYRLQCMGQSVTGKMILAR